MKMRTQNNFQYYSFIVSIFVVLSFTTLASAGVCVDADPIDAEACNTPELQSLLPTRVCLSEPYPAPYNPYRFACTNQSFDAWSSSVFCPKQNLNLTVFCAGTGFPKLPCLMTPCKTDDDCAFLSAPYSPPLFNISCYDCCQQCHEEDYCIEAASNGTYAAPGKTNCNSCSPAPPSTGSTPVGPPVTYVDIDLQGSLRAYTDATFTKQALSFSAGKSAYFLISTSSKKSEVDILSVTLEEIYYGVNNVSLLVNSSATDLAAANNFQWGQHSSSQAWFSFDVTVSPTDVNDNSLFKLNNGDSDVYNFIAMVEVEWTPDSATPNALPSPSASPVTKKRIALQGTLYQGSQFSTQVQIENTQVPLSGSPVSASSEVVGSTLGLALTLLTVLLCY